MFAGVGPVQKAAAAVLLHHLCSGEARQFTEAIWAVDDGVAAVALGVTQQEITVCEEGMKETVGHMVLQSDVTVLCLLIVVFFSFVLKSKDC